MAVTQRDLSLQMLAQLRLLDPSASAEVGTPERKILDTVAQSLFDNQIDLDALATALDINSKYGAGLERFLNLFGFARQTATFATGFATFSRIAVATADIRIPAATTILANIVDPGTDGTQTNVPFYTLFDIVLPAGSTSIVVPIKANISGSVGNVAANTITQISGTAVFGISNVTNEVATSGGADAESDEALKVRFSNTVFRNLAGTQDQYMALATATAFTTKVNVVGPQSYYREYIQVPAVDDASSFDVDGSGGPEAGGGNVGEWTTALSTIPYAKFVYDTQVPAFISNGEVSLGSIFYRQDVDFRINYLSVAARDRGDTLRFITAGLKDANLLSADQINQPNVTFTNVYSGANLGVQAVRPKDIVLFEYAYLSGASRNDYTLNITNAVDVFIDGGDTTFASTVVTRPSTATVFVDDITSKFHYENYRRIGYPEKRPILGNVFMNLYWQPVLDLPTTIVVGTTTYNEGEHYWAVQDISGTGGTVRARNGIEWSTKVAGQASGDPSGNPSLYTGPIITTLAVDTPIEIDNYSYDNNINVLQASLEGSKQVTTDVLAHKSKTRYFKLDVTVMYSPGAPISDTNNKVQAAVQQYLTSQNFGSTIQLSDLLQIIHEVSGIDNVRWTSDTVNSFDISRVYEVDNNGRPLLDINIDRVQPGTVILPEIQGLYFTGNPQAGKVVFSYNGVDGTSGTALIINFPATWGAANIQASINSIVGGPLVTVTEDTRSTTGVRLPVRSFKITKTTAAGNGIASPGALSLFSAKFSLFGDTSTAILTTGPYVIKDDFFLRDDELASLPTFTYIPTSGPADTVPGLIIRPRAQNTWIQPN